MILNPYIIISLLASSLFFYGLVRFLSDYDENKCEMTYMFQYPQFVRISMKIDKHYRKYGLYSYSEGHFTERARKMEFTGIPVLFIPGNAGSHKQVRSLASVALRKAIDSHSGFHFDYFTIDFNGELSGLNGALLHEQVTYAKQAILRILKLYTSTTNPPDTIVLVGHSMGGIIAEGLLSILPNNIVSFVLTLATPHRRPPLYFDAHLVDFYNNINIWDNRINTTFITIFGGSSDFLIPPHLASDRHLSVVTTHIPKMWLPTDHLCILWCKQLVLVLNRALFDVVDVKTKHISKDKDFILSTFRHHLLHNNGIKMHSRHQYNLPIEIDDKGEWKEFLPRQYSVNLGGSRLPEWYMIRRIMLPMHEILSVMVINLEITNWIYACSANLIRGQSRVCIDGMHLSHLSKIVPSHKYKRRFLNVNLHKLDGITHVVVKVPAYSELTTLHVDVHSEADRNLTASLSKWSTKEQFLIEETSENTLYYKIHLPDINHITQTYQLHVRPTKCKAKTHHASATFSIPWSNQEYHAIFTENENKPMDLRLYSVKPPNVTVSPFLELLLDPNCRYSVSIKLTFGDMLSQIARFYSPFIFGNIVVVILLTFRSQLYGMGSKGKCPLFFTALTTGTKPMYILPVSRITTLLLGNAIMLQVLPQTDVQILNEESVGFLSYVLLYLSSIAIVWILAVSLAISIFFFESTVNNIFLKVLSNTIIGSITSFDWILKGLKRFPSFVAILLLSLSMSTCGGLALCLGLIFYYLKLTQMAQDVIEGVIIKLVKILARKLKVRPQTQRKIERFLSRKARKNKNKKRITNKNANKPEVDSNTKADDATTSQSQVNMTNEENTNVGDGSASKADCASTSQIDAIITNEENTNLDDGENKTSDNIEIESASKSDGTSTGQSNAIITNEENTSVEGGENQTFRSTSEELANNAQEDTHVEPDESLSSIFEELTENNELYFHFTLFCLWALITGLNIPTVLMWAHNFRYNSKVEVDPSFIPAVVLCTCALALWQFEYPKVTKKWYKGLSYIVYILAVLSFVYGMISIYRLNYILTSIIALVTLHQVLAPNKEEVVGSDSPPDDNGYEQMKAKLE